MDKTCEIIVSSNAIGPTPTASAMIVILHASLSTTKTTTKTATTIAVVLTAVIFQTIVFTTSTLAAHLFAAMMCPAPYTWMTSTHKVNFSWLYRQIRPPSQ